MCLRSLATGRYLCWDAVSGQPKLHRDVIGTNEKWVITPSAAPASGATSGSTDLEVALSHMRRGADAAGAVAATPGSVSGTGTDSDGSLSSGGGGRSDGHAAGAVRACEAVCLRTLTNKYLCVSSTLAAGPWAAGTASGTASGRGGTSAGTSAYASAAADPLAAPFEPAIAYFQQVAGGVVGPRGVKENVAEPGFYWHLVLAHTPFTPEWAWKVRVLPVITSSLVVCACAYVCVCMCVCCVRMGACVTSGPCAGGVAPLPVCLRAMHGCTFDLPASPLPAAPVSGGWANRAPSGSGARAVVVRVQAATPGLLPGAGAGRCAVWQRVFGPPSRALLAMHPVRRSLPPPPPPNHPNTHCHGQRPWPPRSIPCHPLPLPSFLRCAGPAPDAPELLVQDLLDSFLGVDGRYVCGRHAHSLDDFGAGSTAPAAAVPPSTPGPFPSAAGAALLTKDVVGVLFAIDPSGSGSPFTAHAASDGAQCA